jgi:hypothetical protein
MNKPSEQAIEEYLDRLSAELGALPPEFQKETREELRQHLHSLVAMQRDPQQIADSALRQFGDPREIGRKLAKEWEDDQWSLHGLTLLQRIDKVREAGALESEANKQGLPLKAASLIQILLLLLACCIPSMALTQILGLHLSQDASHLASLGLLGLYFVMGLILCVLEWKEGKKRAAGTRMDGGRTWRNIFGRAGMMVLLPGILIFPQQSPLLGGALILLCLAPAMIMRSSPRTRLTLKVSLVYGGFMGIVICLINTHMPIWLWLLMTPVFYLHAGTLVLEAPSRVDKEVRNTRSGFLTSVPAI